VKVTFAMESILRRAFRALVPYLYRAGIAAACACNKRGNRIVRLLPVFPRKWPGLSSRSEDGVRVNLSLAKVETRRRPFAITPGALLPLKRPEPGGNHEPRRTNGS